AVLTLSLPPLRARGDDILLLAEHYLGRACADYGVSPKTLAPDARAALRAYPWPGNVRELANLMERVALLSSESEMTAVMLGLPPVATAVSSAPAAAGVASSLDDAVRDRVAEVLRQTSWNISRTAALLGISRNTLRARIEKYDLRSGQAPASAPPPRPVSTRPRTRRAGQPTRRWPSSRPSRAPGRTPVRGPRSRWPSTRARFSSARGTAPPSSIWRASTPR